jgi:hypothetical protein
VPCKRPKNGCPFKLESQNGLNESEPFGAKKQKQKNPGQYNIPVYLFIHYIIVTICRYRTKKKKEKKRKKGGAPPQNNTLKRPHVLYAL